MLTIQADHEKRELANLHDSHALARERPDKGTCGRSMRKGPNLEVRP
jgi:hypothetical protein